MVPHIGAYPDCDRKTLRRLFALDQNAGELAAGTENIVRPFQLQRIPQTWRAVNDRVMNRKRGYEGGLRRACRRRGVGEEKCRVKIVWR